MSETTHTPPEGAVSVTAKDVVSAPVPLRHERVEYWLVKSTSGLTESFRIRPEINEKGGYHQSPLDGSFLGVRFEMRSGDDKNEITGERYFPMSGIFHVDKAFANEAVYANGESPAELELKRRERVRTESIQHRAAKLAEGLDDEG